MPVLPTEVLRARLKNELLMCQRMLRHRVTALDPEFTTFPAQLDAILVGASGPVINEIGKVTFIFTHQLMIEITEEYPWEKPIVRWKTPIFHPNIMPPEDGGYVCTKLLDNWMFSSNIMSFIMGIETLLLNPNPKNPYGSDTCTRAAEYFNKHPWTPPIPIETSRNKPKVVGPAQGSSEEGR